MTPTLRVAEWLKLKAAGHLDEAKQLEREMPREDVMAFANLSLFFYRVAPNICGLIAIEAMMLAQLTSHFFAEVFSHDEQVLRVALSQPRALELGTQMAGRFRRLDALREMARRAGRILGLTPNELMEAWYPNGTPILEMCNGTDLNRRVLTTIEHVRGIELQRTAGAEDLACFEGAIEV